MHKIRLLICYDGTIWSGWQVQPNALTIQGEIERVLHLLLKEPVRVIGAGRTDAGVHALGQVAHFQTASHPDLFRLRASMNGLLPQSIRVLEISFAPPFFHAQRSAVKKIYHYHLFLDPVPSPFVQATVYHVRRPLDRQLLQQAAKKFVGTHDFCSFSNEATKGAAGRNAVRTLFRVDIVEEPGGVRMEFEGDGFLYKMVRNIVGTVVDVAIGKRGLEEIEEVFLARDRKKASLAAPARGLFLMQVVYTEVTSKIGFGRARKLP